VIELHCHGGALVARAVLECVLECGVRIADAGEFTRRAFLNGRMDLTQAEAVLDVIQAQTRLALRAANRALDGGLSRNVDAIHDTLVHVLAEAEVRLDFVEEDLDFADLATLAKDLTHARESVARLLDTRQHGEILRHGIRLVIAGAPNAGKSSLLNRILGRDRAIVNDAPGTTRDTLEEPVVIRGIPVQLIDTAGIREVDDPVEQEGVSRSLASMDQAHVVIWIIDASSPAAAGLPAPGRLEKAPSIVAINKIDVAEPPRDLSVPHGCPVVEISALTGAGIEALNDAVAEIVWGQIPAEDSEVVVNLRHGRLLESAGTDIDGAAEKIAEGSLELAAVHLRGAIDALGRITGRTVHADILDDIFANYCIGK